MKPQDTKNKKGVATESSEEPKHSTKDVSHFEKSQSVKTMSQSLKAKEAVTKRDFDTVGDEECDKD